MINPKSISTIISICILFLSWLACAVPQKKNKFCLMLDPAGDAHYAGRKLDNNFERGLTLQIVRELQNQLEERFDHLEIILTRLPGEIVTPLQNANFANRLQVNLYISIHCYQESSLKPELSIIHFSYQNENLPVIAQKGLTWCPYDQAYRVHAAQTRQWAMLMHTIFNDHYAALFVCTGPYAFPFKPLIGITSPAMAIECGIRQELDWQHYIEPLVHALSAIIEKS